MSYSASEIIPRFVKYAGLEHGTEPDGKKGRPRTRFPDGRGSSLYYATKGWNGPVVEIQSYGSHYPLAHLVLTTSGKRRLWVLNGDSWGDRGFAKTGTHQAMAREAAQASGTPWIILPFSALREARINPDTIHVVHQEPEHWEPEEHSAATLEDVPARHRKRHAWRDATGALVVPPRTSDGREAQPGLSWADRADGGWHVNRHSALEGWHDVPVQGPDYEPPLADHYEEIIPGQDGRYHWTEWRHWLGESVFRGSHQVWDEKKQKMVRYARYYLSAFDTNEARPLYFMAELPRGARPQTVTEAREALKPAEVVAAEAAGISVQRQGDVFGIPTALTAREIPRAATVADRVLGAQRPGKFVLDVNHRVSGDVRVTPDGKTYARGKLRHAPGGGRRPEHATITLGDGKTWHLLVKNTVPMGRTWDGSLESRAWSLGGGVD